MKSRFASLLALAVFLCVAFLVFWALGHFEPRYEGVPASVYLRSLMEQSSFGGTNDRNNVLRVPARVGVPILTRYTEAQDSRWRGWYQRLYPKLPRFITRRLGPPQRKDLLVTRSVMALGYYGPEAHRAVPRLLQMEAATSSQMLRPWIFRTLEAIGPRASNAIPMLITHLKSGSSSDAFGAGLALGRIDFKGEKSGALLVSALEAYPPNPFYYHGFDPLVPLRHMAANEPRWINEVWQTAEKSQNRPLFPRGVRFVCDCGALDDSRMAVILSRTASGEAEVRQGAAVALQFPTDRASTTVPRLLQFLRDPDSNVVSAARSSLWSLAQSTNVPASLRVEALRPLFPFEEGQRWPALSVVRNIGPVALPLLDGVTLLLRDPHERVRGRAAEAIVAMGPGARAARPALESLLTDKWGFVREAAEQALRSFNSPQEAR
jgi:hypothetical protein